MKRMKVKLKKRLIIFLSCLLIFSFAFQPVTQVNAWTEIIGYILLGGVTNRTYFNGMSGAFFTDGENAMSSWNNIPRTVALSNNRTHNVRVRVSFRRVTNLDNSVPVRLWSESWANTNHLGGTRFFHQNGVQIGSDSAFPRVDWARASCIINLNGRTSAGLLSSAQRRVVIRHEIGHAMGLGHNHRDNGTLMWPSFISMTATIPTAADIYALDSIRAYH